MAPTNIRLAPSNTITGPACEFTPLAALLAFGMTTAQIAEALSIHASQVNAWASGARPVPAKHHAAILEMTAGAAEAAKAVIGEAYLEKPDVIHDIHFQNYCARVRHSLRLLAAYAGASDGKGDDRSVN